MMSTVDNLIPKTRLNFPGGESLSVGTRRDDDDPTLYGVHVVYDSGQTPDPEMEILLPPHSIDVFISILQEAANQARFIMGQKLVDYPKINKPLPSKKTIQKKPEAKKRTQKKPSE